MAIYDTGYIGTTANRVTFNDFNSSPLFRVRSERPQARQLRELDVPIPFESGIADFRTLVGEMGFIIDGTMYPADEAEFDSGLRSLTKLASLDVAQNDNLSDSGYVPYSWTESNSNTKQIFVKVLYLNREKNTRQGLVLPFQLVCKIKDPTIKGTSLKTASSQGTDPTTSGGTALFDFQYPIIYGAETGSVSFTAINSGDIAAYPESIVINGPVNAPKITNTTSGEYIEVSTNLASSSNQLVITYDKDTVSIEADGTPVLSSMTAASTFFKVKTGTNNFTLTGSSIGSGAYATLTFYDAYPLS